MYYFLGYRLWSREPNLRRRQDKADNTFLLALDGDVDFEPKAMLLLVDLLRKDPKVEARSFPQRRDGKIKCLIDETSFKAG